jgi:Glycosyltransferase family 17
MTRLWDTFMFHDELDMLEVHLTELGPYVWRFILVEAARTHTGAAKPLHYAQNRERFAAWAGQIIHVTADLPAGDPWAAEHAQRDAALGALAGADPDDVVLIADVDEFPPRHFLKPDPHVHARQGLGADPAAGFLQTAAAFAADWLHPQPQVCTAAARAGYARQHGLAAVRDARGRYPQIRGGWHFTWLGGPDAQRRKLASTCHAEITGPAAARITSGACYRDGIWYDGQPLIAADVSAAWPAPIAQRRCPSSWFRPCGTQGVSPH